jgi:Ser/Thr protein kinase RdoA (MazF antagonist)
VDGSIGIQTELLSRMDSRTPDLRDLLGKRVRIVHTKRRLSIQKRIVEFEQQTYVLHFFLRKSTKDRFEAAVRKLQATGISAQHVCTGTASRRDALRVGGHWLALSFLPGTPLSRKAHPKALTALGQTLAKLNSIEGAAAGALFERRQPVLPHEAYLAQMGQAHTPEERRWIEESLARMRRFPANQLTHGDLYGSNIIEQDDHSIGLIDYELMTYDVSGIELAATLMRPFCRQGAQRRSLLEGYLAACPATLRDVWQNHAQDLIFSAATRLLAARQRRIRHLTIRDRLLAAGQSLLPPSLRQRVKDRRDAIARNIASARLNEAYYLHITRTMIGLCLAEPAIDPVKLLERCDKQARKPA